MNKEWSTRYYRSLGWRKGCIASFFSANGARRSNEEQESKKSVGDKEIK